jgi:hypothetical protein
MRTFRWIVATMLVATCTSVFAQSEGKKPWEEYDKLIDKSKTLATLGPDLFGDSASLDTGALSFAATDVSLPGNSGLTVAFTRKFAVSNRKGYYGTHDLPLADWDFDVPRLSGVFARCGPQR